MPLRRRNACHKAIAGLCWELVYHRLVQGAVRQHWLETARRHIEAVLVPAEDGSGRAPGYAPIASAASLTAEIGSPSAEAADADSWMLYGRILLEGDNLEQAKEVFAWARAAGIEERKIDPWLAEIAFRERKFADVGCHLSAETRWGEKGRDLALVKAWWNR
jgi:hypothetical protein